MKKSLVVLMILVFSFSAFAKDDVKIEANKPDIQTMRKIQYYKVVATEEINIIEKFIKCVDGAKDKKMLDMCSRNRHQQMTRLRKTSIPKAKAEKSDPHKPEQKK